MKKVLLPLFILLASSSCQESTNTKHSNDTAQVDIEHYIKAGDKIAAESFQSLSTSLMTAMKMGGVKSAAGFCHIEAQPLTDSLSGQYHAEIKRVALQYRNPRNALSEKDKRIFDDYLSSKKFNAQIDTSEDKITYYKPILLAQPCLKCHGTLGEEVSEEDYAYLKELYPDDRATGFKEGDLRGLWKITFNADPDHTE